MPYSTENDRTSLLIHLIDSGCKHFLARPTGFGKTAFLDELEALYRSGAVRMAPNRILRLDFSKIAFDYDAEVGFQEAFEAFVLRSFEAAGYVDRPETNGVLLYRIAKWLRDLPVVSLAVLIDNYDTPLIRALPNPKLYQEILRELSIFYAILKSEDGCQHSVWMTGLTRAAGCDIFDTYNVTVDLTWTPDCAALFGIPNPNGAYCFDLLGKTRVDAPHKRPEKLTELETILVDCAFTHADRSILEPQRLPLRYVTDTCDVRTIRPEGLLTQLGLLSIQEVDRNESVIVAPADECAKAILEQELQQTQ
ncbi:MAG: AAA family ATPase [Sutterellaceae bacterium]|nr:AAA family ATPase [Sutterellaceae bacterium]